MKGDTVNFLGLEITKTSRGFEVKNSTDARGIPLESLRVGKLENDSQSRNRRSTVMELASAIHLDGHDYSNFRAAV